MFRFLNRNEGFGDIAGPSPPGSDASTASQALSAEDIGKKWVKINYPVYYTVPSTTVPIYFIFYTFATCGMLYYHNKRATVPIELSVKSYGVFKAFSSNLR